MNTPSIYFALSVPNDESSLANRAFLTSEEAETHALNSAADLASEFKVIRIEAAGDLIHRLKPYREHMEDWKVELRNSRIPHRMYEPIELWIERGIKPGHFLCAVIASDLKDAVLRADDVNIKLLRDYVLFFYNHAPGECWGSRLALETWRGERKPNVET